MYSGGKKYALGLILVALFVLTLAIPAQAAVTGLTATDYNPTAYVKTDYTLNVQTDGLSVGDCVYVDFSGFTLGTDFTVDMTVERQVYGIDQVYGINANVDENNILTIGPLGYNISEDDNLSFTICNVINPGLGVNGSFAVSSDNSSWIGLTYIYMQAPQLAIDPSEGNVTVNSRQQLTIALRDCQGKEAEFVNPGCIEGYLYSDSNGYFSKDKAADTNYSYFEIQPGETSCVMYYRPSPMAVGTHTLGIRYADAYNNGYYQYSLDTSQVKATVTALPAGVVNVEPKGDLYFTAGVPGNFDLVAYDQLGNPVNVEEDLTVTLQAIYRNYNSNDNSYQTSTTGCFYYVNEDGTKGLPIENNEVTIAKGNDSIGLCYCDTKATNNGDYELLFETSITPAYTERTQVYVCPASTNKLSLKVLDYPIYGDDWDYEYGYQPQNRLDIANGWNDWEISGTSGEQHNLLTDMIFPVELSILDEFDNPNNWNNFTVNLSTYSDSVDGVFYRSIESYGDGLNVKPITQIDINWGSKVRLYFLPNGVGTATLKASATGFADSAFEINVQQANQLGIHFPLDNWYWDEDTWTEVQTESNYVQPEGRIPFIVVYEDAYGHPARAMEDITVELTGGNFYMDGYSLEDASTVVIPAGCHGVQVYFQAPDTEGTVNIAASDVNNGISGIENVSIEVEQEAYFCTWLERGWNTLSTPVELDRKTVEQVIEDPNCIEIGFIYDQDGHSWLQFYPKDGKWFIQEGIAPAETDAEFMFRPQQAIMLKMKAESCAHFYVSRALTTPPTRELAQGWNFVSAAFDPFIYFYEDNYGFNEEIAPAKYNYSPHSMLAYEALSSIKDKYSQVVSPNLASQVPWVYVPQSSALAGDFTNPKFMEAGRGYWVYMKEPGTLAGFSSTPVDYSYMYGNY